MARYRLRSGARSSVYRPGQLVSEEYARRYPHKVIKERRKRKAPPPPPPPPRAQEWEVTAVKRTRRNKQDLTVDLTFRVTVMPGTVPDKESVRKALWAWAVHGRTLEAYKVKGINWRNIYRDRETEYEYDAEEVASQTVPVLRSVGMSNLRVAPVED